MATLSKDLEKQNRTTIMCFAIIALIILGAIYLLTGHNSVGFTLMISAIVGIAGVAIPSPLADRK